MNHCGHVECHRLACVRPGTLEKVTAPPPGFLVAQLVEDIAAGIRVLRTRDGMPLSESQVLDRARNIVSGLLGNYTITRAP